MAAKYYAVQKGRSTGVFFTWADCQKQVTGFPGAVFKSFLTIEEAEAFVKGQTAEVKDSVTELLAKEPGALIAYVDGSFHSESGAFSYGMVLLRACAQHIEEAEEDGCLTENAPADANKQVFGTTENAPADADMKVFGTTEVHSQGAETSENQAAVRHITELTFCDSFVDEELAAMRNVAGEIKGAEAAMRYAVAHGYRKLYIFHDYEGIAKWCQGVWKTNKEGTRGYKAYYDSIKDKLQVVFVKVAAHTGDKYNEMADGLAKKALGIE